MFANAEVFAVSFVGADRKRMHGLIGTAARHATFEARASRAPTLLMCTSEASCSTLARPSHRCIAAASTVGPREESQELTELLDWLK